VRGGLFFTGLFFPEALLAFGEGDIVLLRKRAAGRSETRIPAPQLEKNPYR